ncbi:MAG TPA: S8 family serine peptidase [Kofleriaceae bacterium]|jgi:serine protease
MDDEQSTKRRSSWPWLLVLVAIVIAYWWFRGQGVTNKVAQISADDPAAQAAIDRDDVLVDLKDDATPAQVAAIDHDLGLDLKLVDHNEAVRTQLYRAHVAPSSEASVIAALSARPEVEGAEPDSIMSLDPGEETSIATPIDTTHEGFPNDPLWNKQWNFRQIGIPEAWKLAQGNGVIVAVLDTGVGYENYGKFHQLADLKGLTFVDPYNFVDDNTHAADDHGHGSHVTGTIAQATNNGVGVAGIALDVKIMPLKVLSASGSGSVAGIADAIRYAADHGAKVINMSLGGAFPSTVLKKAVAYAHGKGVTVICAAGNDGRGRVGYPAAYPGAVAVSATQQDEGITFYSNYGKDIDIAAPGGNTRDSSGGRSNTDGGILQNTIVIGDPSKEDYFAYMGTSMASPHVAGVAALVVGEGVTDPTAVEKILKHSARKPANQQFSADKYGAGIVDAPAAILEARGQAGGWQFAIGLLLAGAVAASARRKGLGTKLGLGYLGGALVGSSGLFFLPYLAPKLSSLPGVHALTHGLPSWDLSLLGVAGHGNALFFSAAIPLALLVIGYGVPKLRGVLAGVAVGVAAHLAFFAVVPMTSLHYVPHAFGLASIWLAVNAIACVLLARAALRR